jgi:hypothetical protein
MNDVMVIDSKINITDIIKSPELYPEELHGAAIISLKMYISELNEAKKIIEGHLKKVMEDDEATKMSFVLRGEEHIATLSNGSIECTGKNIDEIYKAAGFEPLEIGDFIFKSSYKKAKEASKLGGEKKKIIEKYFVRGEKTLKIE